MPHDDAEEKEADEREEKIPDVEDIAAGSGGDDDDDEPRTCYLPDPMLPTGSHEDDHGGTYDVFHDEVDEEEPEQRQEEDWWKVGIRQHRHQQQRSKPRLIDDDSWLSETQCSEDGDDGSNDESMYLEEDYTEEAKGEEEIRRLSYLGSVRSPLEDVSCDEPPTHHPSSNTIATSVSNGRRRSNTSFEPQEEEALSDRWHRTNGSYGVHAPAEDEDDEISELPFDNEYDENDSFRHLPPKSPRTTTAPIRKPQPSTSIIPSISSKSISLSIKDSISRAQPVPPARGAVPASPQRFLPHTNGGAGISSNEPTTTPYSKPRGRGGGGRGTYGPGPDLCDEGISSPTLAEI